MSGVRIETRTDSDLDKILDSDEHVLWTGQPEYGRRLFQPLGAERIYLISMLVGVVVMWGSLPFIDPKAGLGRGSAVGGFAVCTAAFVMLAFYMAQSRQFVLCNFVYFVTNRRSILCRVGRNWRLAQRLYVISNAHSVTYPYEIIPTRPYPSLRIGTLFDEQQVQPMGFGLSHPGQPILLGAVTVPVMFEQVENAHDLHALIVANASDGSQQ